MSDDSFDAGFRGATAPITTYASDAVVTVAPGASIREVASIIAEASVGCVVVGTVDGVEGVVSERDIVRAVAAGLDVDAATVAEIESTSLVWATTDADVGSVAEEMMRDYVRHVLVGDDGRVVGIVSMRDVIAAYTT